MSAPPPSPLSAASPLLSGKLAGKSPSPSLMNKLKRRRGFSLSSQSTSPLSPSVGSSLASSPSLFVLSSSTKSLLSPLSCGAPASPKLNRVGVSASSISSSPSSPFTSPLQKRAYSSLIADSSTASSSADRSFASPVLKRKCRPSVGTSPSAGRLLALRSGGSSSSEETFCRADPRSPQSAPVAKISSFKRGW